MTTQVPSFFAPDSVGEVRRVPYADLSRSAAAWAKERGIVPACEDSPTTALLLVDCQNTFCIPSFELFVAGRSGTGALDDCRRLCDFIYRNLDGITEIIPTLDTHSSVQIFHPIFWVDANGAHPVGGQTVISREDIESGKWMVNPAIVRWTGRDEDWLARYALHYVSRLDEGRSPLMIWPYHSMLGGVGHALVAAVEEAVFFHSVARQVAPRFEIKGRNRLTENYSALTPEVMDGPDGEPIAGPNLSLMERLMQFDRVIVAGQAKSHCVLWTVQDMLKTFRERDESMIAKTYLLEDCTSAVVVPDVVDFTDPADEAFREFAEAGFNVTTSTDM